jgi:hypothetical protein
VKKLFLRSFTVSALSLTGSSVFAQESINTEENNNQKTNLEASNSPSSHLISQEQMEAIKKELSKNDETKNAVTPFGVIQFNANTSDSQRSNVPDFSANKVRAGLNLSGGIASGEVEVEFKGNRQSTQSVNNSNADTSENTANPVRIGTTKGDSGNGSVTIRKAQLNLDVLTLKGSENTFTTTVSFGGIRVGGADATAPDISWTTSGYDRQDGAYLKENMAFGKTASAEIGFGVFNNIAAFGNPVSNSDGYTGWGDAISATIPANWTSPSLSNSHGYLGNVKGSYNINENQSLSAAFYYATQSKSPSNQDSSGNITNARDVTHIEGSLVYNHKNIFGSEGVISGNGISLFYENEILGATKAVSINKGNYIYQPVINKNTITDYSQNTSVMGISAAADSENYLTGMIQKGDRLTYAASFIMVNSSFSRSSGSPNYNVSQSAASIGYAVNTFETAINVAYAEADTKIFSDSNGILNKNNAVKSYITAAYVF